MPEGRSTAKFVHIAPFKVRRIADIVRKKPVREGLALLDVMPHKGGKLLSKVIRCAVSNVLQQHKNLDEEMFYIQECYVNEGPRLRRMWQRARGRADVLRKRMSHITAVIATFEENNSGSKG